MKDIYELLNEINIDFNHIEEMEVTEIERKRGKKKLIQSISKRKNNVRRIIACISTFIIIGTISSPTVAANIPIIGDLIQKSLIDVNKEYENYINVIGTTQSIDNIDVLFENTIADRNMFFLSFVVKDNKKPIDGIDTFGLISVKVNGKNINTSGGGVEERIDENTVRILRTFNWNYERLPENLNIEIEMHLPKLTTKMEKFEAKFSIDTKQIEEKTYTEKLNKSFVVNGIQCGIKEISISPLITNLKYYAETEDENFMLNFSIYDQDGREIVFNGGESTTPGSKGYRRGKIDYNMKYINTENVQKLRFIPKYYINNCENEVLDENKEFTIDVR